MKNVIVYSTPTWPWCYRVKDYLKSKGVAYIDKNVAADRDAAMEMIQKTNQRGVPVIDIDGKMIVGFDVVNINKELGIS